MNSKNQLINLLLFSTAAYSGIKKASSSNNGCQNPTLKKIPPYRADLNSENAPYTTNNITNTNPTNTITSTNLPVISQPTLLAALYAADEASNMNPQSTGPFQLPPLEYNYNALEPYIDEKTLRIHHNKHHKAYVDNLNAALARHPEFYGATLDQLLLFPDRLPSDIQTQVTNNAGGHYNHSLMWKIIGPNNVNHPTGNFAEVINRQFGSFENLKRGLTAAADSVFGSGYAWLVLNPYGRLIIVTTGNQNTPIPLRTIPLLPIDVWEHAYYLKHQNERDAYIEDYFNLINWDRVAARYYAALAELPTTTLEA